MTVKSSLRALVQADEGLCVRAEEHCGRGDPAGRGHRALRHGVHGRQLQRQHSVRRQEVLRPRILQLRSRGRPQLRRESQQRGCLQQALQRRTRPPDPAGRGLHRLQNHPQLRGSGAQPEGELLLQPCRHLSRNRNPDWSGGSVQQCRRPDQKH